MWVRSEKATLHPRMTLSHPHPCSPVAKVAVEAPANPQTAILAPPWLLMDKEELGRFGSWLKELIF